MEKRERALPEWLTNLKDKSSKINEKKPSKTKFNKRDIGSRVVRNGAREHQDLTNDVKPKLLGCVKKEEVPSCILQVRSAPQQVDKQFEFSSEDEDTVQLVSNTSEHSENKVIQNEGQSEQPFEVDEVIDDVSDPPSPSLVQSIPDSDIHVNNTFKLSPNEAMKNELSSEQTNKVDEVSDNSDPPSPSLVQSVPVSEITSDTVNDESDNLANNATGVAGNSVRPSCNYGNNCYRKNTQHRQDFAHPGDDDYSTFDNRPECSYGLSCYRKNPLHRQHYKHTKKVQKPRKAKRPKNTPNGDNNTSDEDSDYDYDDPFINDASSDDYEPECSESDTDFSDTGCAAGSDDDVQQLQKEARKLQRKRKR